MTTAQINKNSDLVRNIIPGKKYKFSAGVHQFLNETYDIASVDFSSDNIKKGNHKIEATIHLKNKIANRFYNVSGSSLIDIIITQRIGSDNSQCEDAIVEFISIEFDDSIVSLNLIDQEFADRLDKFER